MTASDARDVSSSSGAGEGLEADTTHTSEARVLTVHGVSGTVVELAHVDCGHCQHHLSWHVTLDNGVTRCSFCHCLRRPGEDITKPHNFTEAPAVQGLAEHYRGLLFRTEDRLERMTLHARKRGVEGDALQRRLDAVQALFSGGLDTVCRTVWIEEPGVFGGTCRVECVEVPMDDLRRVLDGVDGQDAPTPRPDQPHDSDETGA